MAAMNVDGSGSGGAPATEASLDAAVTSSLASGDYAAAARACEELEIDTCSTPNTDAAPARYARHIMVYMILNDL